MTIGQVARSQQMLYGIVNKNIGNSYAPKPSSSIPSAYGSLLNGRGSGAEDDGDNFFLTPAALKGTVRQIAQRLYDASFSPDAIAEEKGTSSTQGIYTTVEDQMLKAIREQLGKKVESQQFYQPNQTTLPDSFAERQAIAEALVSRLQTVSLPDETTKKIQELALKDAKNSAGAQENGEAKPADTPALSQKDRLEVILEEVQKFAPSKRTAAFNTINKVWENELDRIGAYIKEKAPDWTAWGDKFDASILDDYKAGVNVWA